MNYKKGQKVIVHSCGSAIIARMYSTRTDLNDILWYGCRIVRDPEETRIRNMRHGEVDFWAKAKDIEPLTTDRPSVDESSTSSMEWN